MPDTLRLYVRRVKDGDTLVCQAENGETVDVRVWGIDCPETSQPYGRAAAKAARKLAGGEVATIEVKGRDRYGRLVGRVEAGGVDLGGSLIRSGYAWHDRRHAPEADTLRRLEKRARRKEKGLWEQTDPTPPWEHRKGTRPVSGEELAKSLGWFLLGALGTILLLVLLASM